MSLEERVEEVANELRQLNLIVQKGFEQLKAISRITPTSIIDDAKPVALEVHDEPATNGVTDDTMAIQAQIDEPAQVDDSELDIMGLPWDAEVCSSGRTKYKGGHKFAGCWIKKKGVSEEQYLEKRNSLTASNKPVISGSKSIFDNAPSIPPQALTPPPSLKPPVQTLPEFNPLSITDEQFIELATAYKSIKGDAGESFINNKLMACGFAPGTDINEVVQDDVMAWIAQEIYNNA